MQTFRNINVDIHHIKHISIWIFDMQKIIDNSFYVIKIIYTSNVDHFATLLEFSNINVDCCHKQT